MGLDRLGPGLQQGVDAVVEARVELGDQRLGRALLARFTESIAAFKMKPSRIEMMTITTRSSTRVKAGCVALAARGEGRGGGTASQRRVASFGFADS